MHVAVFGGSFNPPHVGHVLAASYARSMGFERVLAVVVHAHAFAKSLESFEHRVAMAQLAFEPISGVQVSRIEQDLRAPNYTVDTLRALRRLHPDWEMRLLVGSDLVPELPRWRDAEQVVQLAPPFVIERAREAGQAPHTRALTDGFALPAISSTELRKRLLHSVRSEASELEREQDERWLEERLPSAVLAYVRQHGLDESSPAGASASA
jgi:nicotinate-nucleotide adenylyltransferase